MLTNITFLWNAHTLVTKELSSYPLPADQTQPKKNLLTSWPQQPFLPYPALPSSVLLYFSVSNKNFVNFVNILSVNRVSSKLPTKNVLIWLVVLASRGLLTLDPDDSRPRRWCCNSELLTVRSCLWHVFALPQHLGGRGLQLRAHDDVARRVSLLPEHPRVFFFKII